MLQTKQKYRRLYRFNRKQDILASRTIEKNLDSLKIPLLVWVFENASYTKKLKHVIATYKKDLASFKRRRNRIYKKSLLKKVKKIRYLSQKRLVFKKLQHFKPFTKKQTPDIFRYNPMSFTYNVRNPILKGHSKSLIYDGANLDDNFNIAFAYYLLMTKLGVLYSIKYYQTFLKKSRPHQQRMKHSQKKFMTFTRRLMNKKRRRHAYNNKGTFFKTFMSQITKISTIRKNIVIIKKRAYHILGIILKNTLEKNL